jgi:hypothetical protein
VFEQNSPTFKQCDVTYVPIFLGGLMKATGNTPPIQIKSEFFGSPIANIINLPCAQTLAKKPES